MGQIGVKCCFFSSWMLLWDFWRFHPPPNAGNLSPAVLLLQVMDSLLSHLFAIFSVAGCSPGSTVTFILRRAFHSSKWALLDGFYIDSVLLVCSVSVSLSLSISLSLCLSLLPLSLTHTLVWIYFTGNTYASFSPVNSRSIGQSQCSLSLEQSVHYKHEVDIDPLCLPLKHWATHIAPPNGLLKAPLSLREVKRESTSWSFQKSFVKCYV